MFSGLSVLFHLVLNPWKLTWYPQHWLLVVLVLSIECASLNQCQVYSQSQRYLVLALSLSTLYLYCFFKKEHNCNFFQLNKISLLILIHLKADLSYSSSAYWILWLRHFHRHPTAYSFLFYKTKETNWNFVTFSFISARYAFLFILILFHPSCPKFMYINVWVY